MSFLTLDARLCVAAQQHADHMAAIGVLGHMDIGDGDPWTRIRAAGVVFRAASENIARGQTSAAEAVDDWLSDPPHAANVLGDWTIVGFGRSGPFWCADYAKV